MGKVAYERAFLLRPGTLSAVVHELAGREGWPLVHHVPRNRVVPELHQWRVEDGHVTLMELHECGHRLITATHSPGLAERLPERLPLLDGRTVLDQAATAIDPQARLRLLRVLILFQLSAGIEAARSAPPDPDDPKYKKIDDDPRYLNLFAAGLTDPAPGVRRAAIEALSKCLFPGSRTILQAHRDELTDNAKAIDEILAKPLYRIPVEKT